MFYMYKFLIIKANNKQKQVESQKILFSAVYNTKYQTAIKIFNKIIESAIEI